MYRTPRADNRTSYPVSGACGRETKLTPLSPMSCAISGRPHSTISASSVLCARTPTSWRPFRVELDARYRADEQGCQA